jgi:hypothetical protein
MLDQNREKVERLTLERCGPNAKATKSRVDPHDQKLFAPKLFIVGSLRCVNANAVPRQLFRQNIRRILQLQGQNLARKE